MKDDAHFAATDGAIEIGDDHYLRFLEDGNLIWKHPACRSWCEVDVITGTHHHLLEGGPSDPDHITIQGSLMCPIGCGTHGFVRGGKWIDA